MAAPILIVGRAGQLAIDLVGEARARGLAVVARGRPDLDLLDADAPARAIEAIAPIAVINAAAYTAVDKAESEPDLAFALNRDAPARLARACARAGLPLIHLSTDQVFDGTKSGAHTEDDRPNPLSVYGCSKLAGEEAVAAGLAGHLIARVSWLYGPSGDNFVTKLLAFAGEREVIRIVADQRGRPTYAPALAAALLDLAGRMAGGRDDPPRGLLHLAGAPVMTRYDQALAVMRASTARGGPVARVEPVLTRDFPTPARRPLNAELDCSLARMHYGLDLGDFAGGLAATLDALLGRRGGAAAGRPS